MARTFKGMMQDLRGKGGAAMKGRVVEGREVSSSPVDEKGETVITEKTPST